MRRALPHLQMAVLTAVSVGAIALGIATAPSGNPKPFAVTSPMDPVATSTLRAAASATANAQSYTVTANETVTASGRASSVTVQIVYQSPDNIEISTPAGVAAIFIGNTEYSPSPTPAAPGSASPGRTQLKWLQSPVSSLSSSSQEQQNPGALFLNVLEHVPGVHKVAGRYEASGSGIVRSALRAGVSGASSLAGEASGSATITATIVGGFVHLVTFSGTTPGRTYSVNVSYDQVNSSAPVTAPPSSEILNP